jgi:hypothetical protein
MVNQADELPQLSLSAQIDHAIKSWVMVPTLANLNELDFTPEIVNDLLVSFRLPPFNSDIKFPSGHDNPERGVLAR